MNTSIIIAQILGIIFTTMAFSLFTNTKATIAFVEEITKNKALFWTLGLFTVSMGAIIVVFNNVWSSGLELFITIIGWLTLLKGIMMLVFPNTSVSYYKKVNKENMFALAGLIILILGIALLYAGFM
jgi:hypothetical protein